MCRPNYVPRTASPVTRQFFDILKEKKITQKALAELTGYNKHTFQHWKSGKRGATVFNLETALQVLGYRLVIQPIEKTETEELSQ